MRISFEPQCLQSVKLFLIYGPYEPFISGRVPYVYIYIWTSMLIISQTIPIIGPQCSLLGATGTKEHILGTCSWKNGHGNLGIKLKTSTFFKMAPQARPLCS